jgi:surface antigen
MNQNAGTTNPKNPFFSNGMSSGHWGVAKHWYDNANALGYGFDSTPQVGDVAQWTTNPCCSHGHVAYVEQVNGDGSVVVSEYNYKPDNSKVTHRFGLRPSNRARSMVIPITSST